MIAAAALPAGFRRIAFGRVGSTNDEARRLAEAGAGDGLIVTAEMQSAGRGRQGRAWESPRGNLYLSLMLRAAVKPGQAGEFGFGAAVAVAETAERLAGADAKCKWPNDVLVGGRKIAGILLESRGTPERLDWLIVGVGLNVASAPETASWPATSLAALGSAAGVEEALEVLAGAIADWYRRWRAEGFGPLREAWLARAHALGQALCLRRNGGERRGRFVGLDSAGALVLELADGKREAITYGEVLG